MLVEANWSLARSRFVADRPPQMPSGAPSRASSRRGAGFCIPRIGGCGVGAVSQALDGLAMLGANVVMVLIGGTITLTIQRWLRDRGARSDSVASSCSRRFPSRMGDARRSRRPYHLDVPGTETLLDEPEEILRRLSMH